MSRLRDKQRHIVRAMCCAGHQLHRIHHTTGTRNRRSNAKDSDPLRNLPWRPDPLPPTVAMVSCTSPVSQRVRACVAADPYCIKPICGPWHLVQTCIISTD